MPKESFTFLRSIYKTEIEFNIMYYKYVRYVIEQQNQYNLVVLTYQESIKVEIDIKIEVSS